MDDELIPGLDIKSDEHGLSLNFVPLKYGMLDNKISWSKSGLVSLHPILKYFVKSCLKFPITDLLEIYIKDNSLYHDFDTFTILYDSKDIHIGDVGPDMEVYDERVFTLAFIVEIYYFDVPDCIIDEEKVYIALASIFQKILHKNLKISRYEIEVSYHILNTIHRKMSTLDIDVPSSRLYEAIQAGFSLTRGLIHVYKYHDVGFYMKSMMCYAQNFDISLFSNEEIRDIKQFLNVKRRLHVRYLLVIIYNLTRINNRVIDTLKFNDYTGMVHVLTEPLIEVMFAISAFSI